MLQGTLSHDQRWRCLLLPGTDGVRKHSKVTHSIATTAFPLRHTMTVEGPLATTSPLLYRKRNESQIKVTGEAGA